MIRFLTGALVLNCGILCMVLALMSLCVATDYVSDAETARSHLAQLAFCIWIFATAMTTAVIVSDWEMKRRRPYG